MKKFLIVCSAFLAGILAHAQESNVLSAWEYKNVYDLEKKNGNMGVAVENLIKAKQAIDAAAENEKTMGKSKTWKRRTEVYVTILVEPNEALNSFRSTLLDEIYKSIMKARSVEINEKTGKPKIFEESDLNAKTLLLCDTLFRAGAQRFMGQDFDNAEKFFEKRFTLLKDFGKTDTVSLNNMFLCAYRAQKNDRAIELGNQLMALGFADANLYGTMARIYQAKGEGAKGLALIQDARKKYPANTEFITEELNYYLQAGDNQNAVRVLDEAILAFQNDKEMLKALYFNSGVIFGQMGDKAKSKEYYLKALETDPKYYGALNNFAGFLLEEANEIIKQANNLPLNKVKEFDELKAKANDKYKEAASYLERAYEIQPNAKMKTTLLEIFTRLQDEEKMAKYK